MKYVFLTIIALLAALGSARCQPVSGAPSEATNEPRHNIIQLALLLDVSNSMDGLINQAKSELWTIVNEVAKANKNQYHTRLEIALYEYGRSNNDAGKGYVKKLLDYTNDLDTISQVLFSLTTNGGDEYCGWVIQDALKDLQWRDNDSIYRVIFIAGNEPFNQGKIPYKTSCEHARNKHITVNTIHCGDSLTGASTFWEQGARLANGSYFFINQNSTAYDIATPYDSMIGVYNDSLNKTYWAYGSNGAFYKSNQFMQDANAEGMSKSIKAKRAVSKTKGVYTNSKWDALDKAKSDSTWVEKASEEELPQELKGKSITDRKLALDSAAQKRTYFSKQINDLNGQREKYIREHRPTVKERSLGVALIEAIHRQAGALGFVFEEIKN